MFTKTLLEESTECGRYAWDAWTPLIDAATDGRAVLLSRFELPEGHAQGPPHGGHPCDSLELRADDVLRSVPPTPARACSVLCVDLSGSVSALHENRPHPG